MLLAGAAQAQEADDFCRRMGRNQAVFELMLQASTAQILPTPGAMRCTRSFDDGLEVALDSTVLRSETAARQAILMARLPEKNRGKTIEPLTGVGDENGVTRLLEFEAVKGRRHVLMTGASARRRRPDLHPVAVEHRLPGVGATSGGIA